MKKLLSQLIDRVAERMPDQIAYRDATEAVSYGELARQTSQLANLLISEWLLPGDRVGIFLPRCVASARAVHGVLKSGGVFVPIDPQSTTVRLKQLVEDCQIRHLITDKTQAGKILELLNGMLEGYDSNLECVIGLEAEQVSAKDEVTSQIRFRSFQSIKDQPTQFPAVSISENDLAYIMYTSGSTGEPKGIMHTHFSGYQYAELSARTYSIGTGDCIGNHSPLHFDMSTLGYLTSPYAGATTVIIPAAYTKFPASLSELIESSGITIWYSVPLALIQLLLRGAIDKRDFSKLRWILFGGEPFAPKHLWTLIAKLPHVQFSNVYGPAEVNQCTFYHVPSTSLQGSTNDPSVQIPIGKVWERTKKLIVNNDVPVETGNEGELLISTTTMMEGYWQRPDLDQRAFFDFKNAEGYHERYYRTGDLVRENPLGEMEFLGRNDRQIKLRGHRIELDHIEAVLCLHPDVQEAGVYPIFDEEKVVAIGAAVLPQDIKNVTITENIIRSFALERLPSYCVPSKTVISNHLPRTGSGKIDRRELQEKERKHNFSGI